jgi:TetR/AcrR family transcriptional regulator, transcriptional repressor of aconitase
MFQKSLRAERVSLSLLSMPLNKYAPQVATHRRTQVAILEGAKSLIATVGLKKMSMIEIADIAQVSRATLYNHYRDKDSVLRALCESEAERFVNLARNSTSAIDALEKLSVEISQDNALENMRKTDPESLTLLLSSQEDRLWKAVSSAISLVVVDPVVSELTVRWLIGQALYPLTPSQSRQQAEVIIKSANL